MLSLRDTSTNWTRTTRFLVFEAPLKDSLNAVEVIEHHDFAIITLEKPQTAIK